MITQLSLMPDYYPNQYVATTKAVRERSFRIRIRAILRREGFYNFAKLAEEALSHDETYIIDKYGIPKMVLHNILESEFGHACNYSENIASYLHNVRSIANWGLAMLPEKLPTQNKKSTSKKKGTYGQIKNREER